nr:MAG: hypothetical protein 1 [Leviviridae sp.]
MGSKSYNKSLRLIRSTTFFDGSTAVNSQLLTRTFSRTATDDPLYLSKILSGLSATNAMDAQRVKSLYRHGLLKAIRPFDGATASSTYNGLVVPTVLPAFPASVAQRAKDIANMRCISKYQKEISTFSGATFLGELRKTVHMIRHPASSLGEYTRSYLTRMSKLRRTMPRKNFSKVLSETWLEYSFGVAPLVNDIFNIAEASIRRFEPCIIRLSASGFDATATSTWTAHSGGVTSFVIGYPKSTIHICKHTTTIGVNRELTQGTTALERIVEYGNFNLSDIVPTAWELLPFSFLIDYFSNIGDILSAATMSFSSLRWTSQSSKQITQMICYDGKVIQHGGGVELEDEFISPQYLVTRDRLIRSADGLSIPSLRFELPGRKNQFYNLAALMRVIRS